MAIWGIGIDLVEVDRIQKTIERFGERFKNRIFTKEEQKFCESQKNKHLSYAARFAAKEAFSKALGTGLRGKIGWREIVVIDNERTRPQLTVLGKAKELLNNRKTYLSLTHTDNYASAIVIIEE
ncbi:MAG: holo-ACP synthase [candidate division WOR-3 bacterium]|nr:holo-ACP synthase [candidate division WOR-3 bacterium]